MGWLFFFLLNILGVHLCATPRELSCPSRRIGVVVVWRDVMGLLVGCGLWAVRGRTFFFAFVVRAMPGKSCWRRPKPSLLRRFSY